MATRPYTHDDIGKDTPRKAKAMYKTIATITKSIAQPAFERSSLPIVGPMELKRDTSIFVALLSETTDISDCRSCSVRSFVRIIYPVSPVSCTCVPVQLRIARLVRSVSATG